MSECVWCGAPVEPGGRKRPFCNLDHRRRFKQLLISFATVEFALGHLALDDLLEPFMQAYWPEARTWTCPRLSKYRQQATGSFFRYQRVCLWCRQELDGRITDEGNVSYSECVWGRSQALLAWALQELMAGNPRLLALLAQLKAAAAATHDGENRPAPTDEAHLSQMLAYTPEDFGE